MCFEWQDSLRNVSFKEVCLRISKLQDNTRPLELIGGEPTLSSDIEEIVNFAYRKGFRSIGITSNGRRFADVKFCKTVTSAGLSKICISLHGNSKKIHDSMVGQKGAFEEALKGIENLMRIPGVSLEIKTVLCRENVSNILEFKEFISNKLGIGYWNLSDLIPMEGLSDQRYKRSLLRLIKIARIMNKLDKDISGININFFEYPLCVFKEGMINKREYLFFNAKEVAGDSEDKLKTYGRVCRSCKMKNNCGGYWDKYLQFFGEEELRPFS